MPVLDTLGAHADNVSLIEPSINLIDKNQSETIPTHVQVRHTRAVGDVGCACIPIVAVAIAVPDPSQPAQVVDEETRSASGSEPGDEVLDVQTVLL